MPRCLESRLRTFLSGCEFRLVTGSNGMSFTH
jgi:hypothetical protein